jgi:hypothetical protein
MPVIPFAPVVVSSELDRQRDLTWRYIQTDPTLITLTPQTRVKQGNGSVKLVDGTPRVPQTFKLIPQIDGQKPTVNVNGVERIADLMLMARWDAQIARDDYWIADGKRYTVIELASGHGYEIKAMIESHG